MWLPETLIKEKVQASYQHYQIIEQRIFTIFSIQLERKTGPGDINKNDGYKLYNKFYVEKQQ